MPEVALVCEGSSDEGVLSPILTKILGTEILVRPAGGVVSIPFVADYVTKREGMKVACIVDRDYRRREVADATYSDGKRTFMWRRHAIESYFVVPEVIGEMSRQLKSSVASNPGGGPRWIRRLPEDPAVIEEGLRECARDRAPKEAGRIALQRLWEDLHETAGRVSLQRPSLLDGNTVADAATCRDAVVAEAARLVTSARGAVESPHLIPDSVRLRYEQELARITTEAYVGDLCFLEEQDGRDLFGAFLGWLQRTHQSVLSHERASKELPRAAVEVYRKAREENKVHEIFGTDDFLDLANGVLAFVGLPPVS